jgi:hypothetical protein
MKHHTIDSIIEQSFDFSSYSEQEKQSLIDETSSMIMEASLLRALTDASAETQQAFRELIEGKPSEEQMSSFINEHLPGFGDIVSSEITTFLSSGDAQELR